MIKRNNQTVSEYQESGCQCMKCCCFAFQDESQTTWSFRMLFRSDWRWRLDTWALKHFGYPTSNHVNFSKQTTQTIPLLVVLFRRSLVDLGFVRRDAKKWFNGSKTKLLELLQMPSLQINHSPSLHFVLRSQALSDIFGSYSRVDIWSWKSPVSNGVVACGGKKGRGIIKKPNVLMTIMRCKKQIEYDRINANAYEWRQINQKKTWTCQTEVSTFGGHFDSDRQSCKGLCTEVLRGWKVHHVHDSKFANLK